MKDDRAGEEGPRAPKHMATGWESAPSLARPRPQRISFPGAKASRSRLYHLWSLQFEEPVEDHKLGADVMQIVGG